MKLGSLITSAVALASLVVPMQQAPAVPMLQNPAGIEVAYSASASGTFPVAPSAGQVLGDETSAAVTQADLDQSLHMLRQDVATLVTSLIVQLSSGQSLPSYITASQYSSQIDAIHRAIGRSSSEAIRSLTAQDIPDLSGTYLALSGGTLTGALVATATSTLAGITLNTDCSAYNNGGKLTTDASGNVVCGDDTAGSGSGTPGGSTTQVQFNDAGDFGGDAGFTYSKTADRLTVGFASTTGISADYASTTNLVISGVSNSLLKTVNGVVTAAVAGTDYQAAGNYATFAYPFPSNATSTNIVFSGGILSLASTTIGNGTATGGLTISGGATTTGIAYFAGNVGIGVSAPAAKLDIANAGGIKLSNGLYSGQLKSSDTTVGLDGLVVRTGDDLQYGSLTLSGLLSAFSTILGNGGGFLSADMSLYRTLVNKDDTGTIVTASGGQYSWNSAAGFGFSATADTGLARQGAGAVKVTDGSTGLGSLIASSVGIGTTSPGASLDISGSAAAVSAYITNTSSTGQTELQVRNNGAAAASALRIGTLGTGYSSGSGAFVQNGGFIGADTSLSGGLSIMARAVAGALRFYTGGSADANERLRITSSGNVGIGTTSPSATFAVTGSGYFSGALTTGSILSKPTANYWSDTGSANNVGIGGRLFVGSNYRNTGDKSTFGLYLNGVASWIDGEATMGYYDTRSQLGVLSGQGRIAIAAASRTSDNVDENAGDNAAIGVAAFVLNNSTSTVNMSSWAFYGHATQLEANRFTTAMELDTNSYQPLVNVSPYLMGSDGTTAGLWLGVGGEDAAYVAAGNTYHGYTADDIQPVSVALGIVNSVSAAPNNLFAKGIVIQDGALIEDANGRSIWAQIADGQMLDFKYGGGASSTVGQMFSEANGGSPNNQTHLVYAKTGFEIRGVKSTDYSQENKLLQLIAPTTSGDTDYFQLTPGVAGSNAVTFAATGTDATVNISLMPKSGSVGIGTANPVGTLDAVSTHATGIGGIGLISRDSVTANSNPFIYSYKTGGAGGAVANLGLNVYFSSNGTGGQRINSTKNGWAFNFDTRSTNDAQLDLQQVSSSGVLSTFATFSTNGNVGIGSTTPGSVLSVNGVANFAPATSTFYSTGGINLAAGCFAINGACLSTSGGSSFAYPFPSNATSTLLAFSGGLTAFASSTIGNGTQIGGLTVSGGATTTGNAYFAGNVGIGTASPSTNLDIVGSAVAVSAFITSTNAGGQAELQVRNNNGSASTNALRLGALGTSYSTSGAFVQSGAFVDADTSLAGGLSIMARASAGVIRFYTGGATAANESMRITSAGNVGVGTTSPSSKLTVWGADAASSTLAFNIANSASSTVFAVFNGGNAQLSGTLTQSSDRRLKTNVESLDASTTLAALEQLNPVTFNWIDRNKGDALQIGFIAQDVQKIFPDLVSTTSPTALTPNGTLGVNYIGFIAPIIKSIQALADKVASLAAAISGFAQSFTSHEVHATDKLCVGETCVTEAQLQQLLANQGMRGSSPTPSVPAGDGATSADGVAAAPAPEETTSAPSSLDTEEPAEAVSPQDPSAGSGTLPVEPAAPADDTSETLQASGASSADEAVAPSSDSSAGSTGTVAAAQ